MNAGEVRLVGCMDVSRTGAHVLVSVADGVYRGLLVGDGDGCSRVWLDVPNGLGRDVVDVDSAAVQEVPANRS